MCWLRVYGWTWVCVSCHLVHTLMSLWDTDSMVSTIMESCFVKHFKPSGLTTFGPVSCCSCLLMVWLYHMWVILSWILPCVTSLCPVVGSSCSVAPGVLGMNMLWKCYQELYGQYGTALYDLPLLSQAPSPVCQALQYSHRVSAQPDQVGWVKVWQGKGVCVPGGTLKLVAATCDERYSSGSMFFESSDNGLPGGLLATCSLVEVVRRTAYIPVWCHWWLALLLYHFGHR